MSNINVAIADDNERIRHNLKDIVSREQDMTIVGSASDGVDAVSMIRRTHPDVVLLDIIMPKMDGLGVLEEIQKDKEMEKKPAFFYWLGTRNEENDCVYSWHSPHFKADERCIAIGAGTYAMSVFRAMECLKK